MNHLRSLLDTWQRYYDSTQSIFLATVIKTQGSTYRRPGARMLITLNGDSIGMVSGGCLENDIIHHVQQQQDSAQPFIVTYDITTEEDIAWGFGLGCDGTVQVLIESLNRDQNVHPLQFIHDCFEQRQPGVLATIIQADGLPEVNIGDRLSLVADGSLLSDISNPALHDELAIAAQTALRSPTAPTHSIIHFGEIEAVIEIIQPPPALLIFGAGRDAVPLVQFAKALGWEVTVVDCRSLDSTRDRFALADHILLTRRELLDQVISIDPDTIAVVMTHNYFDDLAALKLLSNSPAQYIGMLGSRDRTQNLIKVAGVNSLDRLHTPIGLDIGAETPEEIAIAILAEIQAAIANRPAGFLRDRLGSIH
jgi:xanthine dehydrogenase accessory factor